MSSIPDQIPLVEGLFSWPSANPCLWGSRCKACGTVDFPTHSCCPNCFSNATEVIPLSHRGTLWTWTIQGFPPKAPYLGPQPFEHYGVGYVELKNQVIVEARLTTADPEKLRIGMPMELVIEPFARNAAGQALMMYAFKPEGVN